jgi:anti-sigma-K factor RskA
MKHDNPKLIDALAAEYVLGTLGGRARRRFERWRSKEWHVERRVQAWEERLSGLALRLSPMRPSPHVWSQIERRIGAKGSGEGTTTTPPRQRAARWQAIAASVALIVVLAGGFFMYRSMLGPTLYPMATVIAKNATDPAWQLSADDDLRHLRARAGAGATAQAGKSYELWALPDSGAAPVSLGVIPAVGEIDRELTDAQRAALRGASKVAVSLEPEGGSTTGAPTGPVLFVADRAKRA